MVTVCFLKKTVLELIERPSIS